VFSYGKKLKNKKPLSLTENKLPRIFFESCYLEFQKSNAKRALIEFALSLAFTSTN
jgi:hypothetical protein